MVFYYAPGSSALASHIALEESGLAFEARPLSLRDQEQRSEAYLAIVPAGKVPALIVDDRILMENVAILWFIATSASDARLLPDTDFAAARALAHLAWYASTIHPTFRRAARPAAATDEVPAQPGIAAKALAEFVDQCASIDAGLAGGPWALGERYSVCDGYLLLIFSWAVMIGMDLSPLGHFRRHARRMLDRPAVRRALDREGSLATIEAALNAG